MGKPRLDLDRAAMILAEAIVLGDIATAKKYGISRVTVAAYRKRSHTDKNLMLKLKQKKELAFSGWHDELQIAIMAGINFIKRATQEADAKDPAVIHAIAGATNLLLETQLRKEIIDVKFNTPDLGREPRPANFLLDAIPSHIEE